MILFVIDSILPAGLWTHWRSQSVLSVDGSEKTCLLPMRHRWPVARSQRADRRRPFARAAEAARAGPATGTTSAASSLSYSTEAPSVLWLKTATKLSRAAVAAADRLRRRSGIRRHRFRAASIGSVPRPWSWCARSQFERRVAFACRWHRHLKP